VTAGKSWYILTEMKLSQLSFFQKYLYFLVHIKGLLSHGFAKKYYSQVGEDIVLEHLFSGQRKGFYVDVGAYHPKHYSNTYLLYKMGWRGINIDPNPNSIRLFNWHRRRDTNLNYGINTESSTRPYFIFNHQSCNTFSTEQKDLMLKKSFIQLIKETNILCVPLQELLDEHASGKVIDLLNVDVEGMGMQVLQSLDWNKIHPKVICVEDDDFDFTNKEEFGSEIFSFLNGKSYILHAKTGLSCIYTLKS